MAKKKNTSGNTAVQNGKKEPKNNKWAGIDTSGFVKGTVKKYNQWAVSNSELAVWKKMKPVKGSSQNSATARFIQRNGDMTGAIEGVNKATTPSVIKSPMQVTNPRATDSSNFVNYKYPSPTNILNRRTGAKIVTSNYLKSIGYQTPDGTKTKKVEYMNDVVPVYYNSTKYDNNNPKRKRLVADSANILNTKKTEYKDLNLNTLNKNRFKTDKDGSIIDTQETQALARRASGTSVTLKQMMEDVRRAIMISDPSETTQQAFEKLTTHYNRFKLPNPNLPLQHGHAHVFFVRPDCNILTGGRELISDLQYNELFRYAYDHTPKMLGELVQASSYNSDNQFMMSLSNFASSFSLSDEYINTDTYGRTYTGYKVSYGKNNVESKTASTFDVVFNDDRYLHIYQIIRLWVEYINGVYRGMFSPTPENIFNKILDYTGAVYYIITAEDGETIIFWSKYYGVYPSTIPSSQYSWGEGNIIQAPQLSVTFNYSFKEDFNPYAFAEFNYNSKITERARYVTLPTYDYLLGHSSDKFGRKPFVEVVHDPHGDAEYVFKLRLTKN